MTSWAAQRLDLGLEQALHVDALQVHVDGQPDVVAGLGRVERHHVDQVALGVDLDGPLAGHTTQVTFVGALHAGLADRVPELVLLALGHLDLVVGRQCGRRDALGARHDAAVGDQLLLVDLTDVAEQVHRDVP